MTNTEKEFILKLNALIEDNLENPNFTTEEICLRLGLSRSHLFRLVKEQSNLSVSLYIRQIRLIKGKELLNNPDLKISEITYLIGIDSPQNFSRYFIKEFGINPREYRKNEQPEDQSSLGKPLDLYQTQAADDISTFSQNETSDSPSVFPQRTRFKIFQKFNVGFIALGLLVILAMGYNFIQNKKSGDTTFFENAENSIAVLPFKNLGAPETTLFAEGIMEQVHGSLASIENIKVISKTSSLLFRDSKKTVSQIARELSVHYILEGTVLKVDSNIKVNIELINGVDDQAVWTKSFETNTKDVVAAMSKVAKEIAVELHQKLNAQLNKKLEKVATTNLEAYNLFLQGRQLKSTREKEKLEASISKFDAAIAMDSLFADAYANKAEAYTNLAGQSHIDPNQCYKLAEKEALKAIRLDAENGLAFAILANVYQQSYKWEQSITAYQIALKYSPNDALINYWYSLLLRSLGQLDAAVKYSAKARALDPLIPVILAGHIRNCSYAHKENLVHEAIENGRLLFDNSFLYYWAVGYYLIDRADYTQAYTCLDKSRQMNPNVKGILAALKFTQGRLGQLEPVKTYLDTLPKTPEHFPFIAIAYAGINDKENCLKYLNLAADNDIMPVDIKVAPFFYFLHNDKRFDALLDRFGLLNPNFKIDFQ